MSIANECSQNTGLLFPDLETCETCLKAPWKPSTSSAAGSPANLFRWRVNGKVKVIYAGCGQNSPAWWLSYDRDGCCWKTCPDCLPSRTARVPQSSLILPRWATMRNGVVFLRQPLEHLTADPDGSAWPLLDANAGARGGQHPMRINPVRSFTINDAVKMAPTLTSRDHRSGKASQATHDKNARPLSEQVGGLLNPTWCEWYQGFETGWTELED